MSKRLKSMHQRGNPISEISILSFLKDCLQDKNSQMAPFAHQLMISHGFECVAILAEHLIRLFILNANTFVSNLVFRKVETPNVYTWHSFILAHVNHTNSWEVFGLFMKMLEECIEANKFIYMCMLKACGNKGDRVCDGWRTCGIDWLQ